MHYLVGAFFDRTTNVTLHCRHRSGDVFSNKGQPRTTALTDGEPWRDVEPSPTHALEPGRTYDTVSLHLIYDPVQHLEASDFAAAHFADEPQLWRHTSPRFASSAEAMQLVSDVVALLRELRLKHRISRVRLFCALPSHVVALLAANLTEHVVKEVAFMELNKGSSGLRYVHLPMPRGPQPLP